MRRHSAIGAVRVRPINQRDCPNWPAAQGARLQKWERVSGNEVRRWNTAGPAVCGRRRRGCSRALADSESAAPRSHRLEGGGVMEWEVDGRQAAGEPPVAERGSRM